MSIAEQMGLRLQNTAHSVNIKERLDFSCAIFDAAGRLIANAPHIPVHLGSMGESIETVIAENRGQMRPGDVFVLNAPYQGGTHLPDITVVTPVFDDAGGEILFFLGSRGHHADVGGTSPGSMPADSRHVDEEGVLIDNFRMIDGGVFREAETRALLLGRPLAGAQRRAEPGRPARAGRRQREGRAGAARSGRALGPAGGARVHAARAGQRRAGGPPRDRRAR